MPNQHAEQNRILIVESDLIHRSSLSECLEAPDMALVEVASVAEAFTALTASAPDLIVSAAVLEDGSGYALCRGVRENADLPRIPIILMSPSRLEMDRILGFECGADDVVTMPYFPRELVSRVRAMLRRRASLTARNVGPGSIPKNEIVVNARNAEVRVGGERVELTPRELALLVALIRCNGRILKRSELVERVGCEENPTSERSIDAHVKGLRRKLGTARSAIETVRGLGYRLARSADAILHDSPMR
jgi:DNA-binding response OmpR family regulator